MRKLIKIGYVKNDWEKRSRPVHIEIELENGRLSIMGSIWKNAYGQINMDFNKDGSYKCGQWSHFEKGWSQEKFADLLAIWDEWHLNDLKPFCYCLKKQGYIYKNEDIGRPCFVCGEPIGEKWYTWPLPQEIIDFLTNL